MAVSHEHQEPDSVARRHLFLGVWSLVFVAGALSVLGLSRPRPDLAREPALEIATTAASPRNATAAAPAASSDPGLAFIANQGQWSPEIAFAAGGADFTATFQRDRIAVSIRRLDEQGQRHVVPVALQFEGSRPETTLTGEGRLPGVHHYLLGADPKRWQRDVPRFAAIRYHELYPGIDLVAREGVGPLQYDLLAEAGADWREVTIAVSGVDRLESSRGGGLRLITRWGPVEQGAPRAWYEHPNGVREPVECRYRLLEGTRFGFEVAEEAPWPLVIDPPLEWSTLLGGSDLDWLSRIAVDVDEATIVAGTTASIDFPTTPGVWDETLSAPGWDLFVSKFDASGSQLLFSTFLGGEGYDYGRALDLDLDGTLVVGGWTTSTDFPTTPGAYDTTPNGQRDGFVARLAADGSQLVYSTLYGGSSDDAVHALDLDPLGRVFITGETSSNDVPTTATAFDSTFNGGSSDLFVAQLDTAGSQLLHGTYLGGASLEEIDTIEIGGDGAPVIAGRTWSADFPTTPGAFDSALDGLADAFVVRFAPELTQLRYATLLGGSSLEWADDVALQPGGQVTVAGFTESPDFPTTPFAFDDSYDGGGFLGTDAFVARLSADGSQLVFSTFLGGTDDDFIYSVVLDDRHRPIVAGMTRSDDFPVTPGAFATDSPGFGAHPNGFVARLSADGRRCDYATYLGGLEEDLPLGVGLAADGSALVGGYTRSIDFPVTPGAFSDQHAGGYDVFVTRLRLGPTVELTGLPIPGHLTYFTIEGAPSALSGHSAQVLLSCTGTSGIPLPGGLVLPLTSDACTSIGLRLAPVLRCTLDPAGIGRTPAMIFPTAVPSGMTIYYAAVCWDPSTAFFSAITPARKVEIP